MLWENIAKLLNEAFTVGDDPIKKEISARMGRDLGGIGWSDQDHDPELPSEDREPALSPLQAPDRAPS